ncbi:Ubiquinone biosynthesis protein COQ9, partial [Blattella germanica]
FPGLRFLWTTSKRNVGSVGTTEEYTSSSSEESDSNNEQEVNIKSKILAASLPFVNEYGWTKNAISKGAQTVGFPGTAHGLFPRGGAELVQYFYVTCNQELVAMMKKECEISATDPSKQKQPVAFIQNAVEQRLRMIVPYINKWPQALGIMSLPPNVPPALANLLTLFSWYSRRVALAGIYKMTELYMIQDKSADFKDTWQFLGRRIEDVSQLHNYLHQSGEASQVAKEAVTAAFITVSFFVSIIN